MTWTLVVQAPRYKLQRSVIEQEINGYWEQQIEHVPINTGYQHSIVEVTGESFPTAVQALVAYEPEVKIMQVLREW